MTIISSRPQDLEFDEFVTMEELQLIAALLYNVKLGKGSVWREAALSLLQKIETYVGDVNMDFSHDSAQAVNVKVNVLDGSGRPMMVVEKDSFEIDV